MKKLNFKFIAGAFSLVVLFNLFLIVVIAFFTEKEVTFSPENMAFNDVFYYNSDEDIDDYYLLNWEYSKDGCMSCSNLSQEVINANLTRLTRRENIMIHLIQTKNNSIIQIKPYTVDSTKKFFVNSVEVVNICNSFYIIITFSEYIDDGWEMTSAVYKSESDLSQLYEFETQKERYYFYEFYPRVLAPLCSSIIAKIFNVLFVIGEVTVVYVALVRRTRHGTVRN